MLPLQTHTHWCRHVHTYWSSVSAFKVRQVSQHTLTQQREYMTKGGYISVSVCEHLWMCVFEKGKGRWTACVCFRKRQTDFMCVHVSVCLCVFKAFISCFCTDSAELFWQCRSTNTDTSSVGVFTPNNTEKAHASDQSCRITQWNITA